MPSLMSDTGDICRRTPQGNLIVEGRDKDMINRGGEKISAEEVENLLHQLPGVSEVAAVAMADPVLGELPVTKVGKVDKKALRDDITRRLGTYARAGAVT
jgi:non-ribosomal peptide synthetase component E (peptide arylation enzyme)